MPATLTSGRNVFQPTTWVETGTQELLGFDGINLPVRWDGLTAATESVGIQTPATAPSLAQGGSGALTAGTYQGYVRFFDDEGYYSSVSPVGAVTIVGSKNIAWTNIPIPTDSRVIGRQLLRTTNSQAFTAYEVTVINDIVTTTYTDNVTDSVLSDSNAVVVANADGSIPAEGSSRDQPPNHMSVVVQHQQRMYGGIPIIYNDGQIEVTNGSPTVTGINTNFTSTMVGRNLLVVGETSAYLIQSVNSATSITLTANFAGTTNYFARYSIQSERAERLNVYYSYIGFDGPEYEAWSALFSFSVPAYGGDITALIPLGQRMYIAKLGYMYSFSQSVDPAIDGNLVPAPSGRGCENQFTWCRADDTLFLLDRQGVYAFTGGMPNRVSDPIQTLFYNQVNWAASKWFRMVYDREAETVKIFLSLGEAYLPSHALCYYAKTGDWFLEEFPYGVGAADIALFGERSRVLLGCEHARVMLTKEGQLDGIDPLVPGNTRGTMTGVTLSQITDSTANWPSNIVDRDISVVDQTGKFQTRRITAATATTLTLNHPWKVMPDTTSVYQIGGFGWHWKSGIFAYTARSNETSRFYEFTHQPTKTPNVFYLRQQKNHSAAFERWALGQDSGIVYDQRGVQIAANDDAIRLDTYLYRVPVGSDGQATEEDPGHRRVTIDSNLSVMGNADRWVQTTIQGFASESPFTVFELSIGGVRQ